MATLLVFHEVDDVDHWPASPKRDEFFGPMGISTRTFRGLGNSNRVGVSFGRPWTTALFR